MTIKTTDKDADKPVDRLPEPDDDIEVQAAADPAPQDEPADAPEPEREEEEKPLSPREALVQMYRQKRDRELAQKARAEQETDEETEADAADAADEPPPAPAAKAKAPAAQPAAQPAAAPPAPAEKATDPAIDAVRTLLEETRAVLEEAKAVRVAPAAPQAQAEPESEPAPKAAAPAIDEARLEEIVERIQIGDKAEGRQALAELIEIMGSKVTPGMQPDEIARVVQTQIAQDRIIGEMAEAVDAFKNKYTTIAGDADLLDASIRRLNGELRADLVKAGVPEKDLRGLDSERLMQIHNQARIYGKVQRGYGEIFDTIGNAVHTKFSGAFASAPPAQPAAPAPRTPSTPAASPSVVADRVDRKRALSVQPRAAGVRSESQPQQKPKTREQIVADMRRARGFKI